MVENLANTKFNGWGLHSGSSPTLKLQVYICNSREGTSVRDRGYSGFRTLRCVNRAAIVGQVVRLAPTCQSAEEATTYVQVLQVHER